jgi:hypothetical protein
MKPFLSVILLIFLIACSPYKKIVLSASDRLTKNWKGASQASVNTAYGTYKRKVILPDGYLLSFDYSYSLKSFPASSQSGNFQARITENRSSPMLPPATNPYNGQTGVADSVIHRIDFVFDTSQHVKYVEAIGLPDSVYYVKRK